jgi:hypothetical protein
MYCPKNNILKSRIPPFKMNIPKGLEKEPNDGFARMARHLTPAPTGIDPLLAQELKEEEVRERNLLKQKECIEYAMQLDEETKNRLIASMPNVGDNLELDLDKRAKYLSEVVYEPNNVTLNEERKLHMQQLATFDGTKLGFLRSNEETPKINEERRARLLSKYTTLAPDLSDEHRRKKANFILRAYLGLCPSDLLKEAEGMSIDLLEECVNNLR